MESREPYVLVDKDQEDRILDAPGDTSPTDHNAPSSVITPLQEITPAKDSIDNEAKFSAAINLKQKEITELQDQIIHLKIEEAKQMEQIDYLKLEKEAILFEKSHLEMENKVLNQTLEIVSKDSIEKEAKFSEDINLKESEISDLHLIIDILKIDEATQTEQIEYLQNEKKSSAELIIALQSQIDSLKLEKEAIFHEKTNFELENKRLGKDINSLQAELNKTLIDTIKTKDRLQHETDENKKHIATISEQSLKINEMIEQNTSMFVGAMQILKSHEGLSTQLIKSALDAHRIELLDLQAQLSSKESELQAVKSLLLQSIPPKELEEKKETVITESQLAETPLTVIAETKTVPSEVIIKKNNDLQPSLDEKHQVSTIAKKLLMQYDPDYQKYQALLKPNRYKTYADVVKLGIFKLHYDPEIAQVERDEQISQLKHRKKK